MSPFLRLMQFLVASLGCAAVLRADSTLNIAGVRADLKSADVKDELSALQALKGEEKIPDELIGDVVAEYVQFTAPDDPTKPQPKSLSEMMNKVVALGSFDDLWDKMDPVKLADALRPYLNDNQRAQRVIEVPSHSKRISELLVPELQRLLQAAPDENTVYWCTKALIGLGPKAKPATDELVGLLANKSDKNRECATRALLAIGLDDPKYVPALLKGLGDSDITVSDDCGTLLSKLKFDPSTQVPQLLDDLNGGFNYHAIDYLEQIGPKIVQPTIDHAANAPFEGVDNHLCILRKFSPQATPLIADDLHSPNDNLRYMALDMATEFPSPGQKGVNWLTPYLTDTNKSIRLLALEAWIKAQPDVAKRIELLGKDIADPDMRDDVIELAGDQGPAAKPLLPAIRQRAALAGDEERMECLRSEFDIDPSNEQAYQDIITYLKNPDYIIFSKAVSTLIYDPKLRAKSAALIKKIHDDPATDFADRSAIEMDWKYAPKN